VKKIAFGCTLLNRGLSGAGIDGIGHYCQEILSEHSKSPKQLQMLPYSFGYLAPHSQLNTHVYASYPAYLVKAFANISSSSDGGPFLTADLIHAPDHLIPIIKNSNNRHIKKTPLVATIMDVIPISHPQFIHSKVGALKANLWKFLASRVDHIITISEFSKTEIAKHIRYPLDKITVTALGVNDSYFQEISKEQIHATLEKYSIPENFFLSIGTIQPRKNLVRLLKAHAALPRSLALEFPLVIVGRLGWDDGKILATIREAITDSRCIWVNYINEEEKRCLLQATVGVPFISLYEGFGLPMIEAFASGSPVIGSNSTALAELGLDTAILVDPLSLNEITNALNQLINSHSLRMELKKMGRLKANQFTWRKTWDATHAVYEKLIN
jgi:alpha-1,3-rhamnosyl/mannosyltransferase